MAAKGSKKVIYAALVGNGLIAITKFIAAFITRSSAMFSEGDLDKSSANVPKGFEDLFGTYRLCLQYASDHWYMHRGQLADARRAAGLERMWL